MSELKVECYWDAEDREHGHSDPYDIIDYKNHGSISEIEHVAVVKVTFQGLLPAAEDSDCVNDFEVCEKTREAAEAKMQTEITRRKQAHS